MVKTGDIAKVFGVHPKTVCKWIDRGGLPGYRMPMTLIRVVRIRDVLRFAIAHRLPMENIPSQWYTSDGVAVIGDPGVTLPECDTYATYMDYMFRGKPAGVMIVDTTAGTSDAFRLIAHIAAKSPDTAFVIVVPEDFTDAPPREMAAIRHVVRQRPVNPTVIATDVLTFRGSNE